MIKPRCIPKKVRIRIYSGKMPASADMPLPEDCELLHECTVPLSEISMDVSDDLRTSFKVPRILIPTGKNPTFTRTYDANTDELISQCAVTGRPEGE